MNRRDVLRAAGTAALGAGLSGFPLGWSAAAKPTAAKKILMFTRSQTFEHPAIKRDTELAYVRELEGVVQVVEKTGETKKIGLGWAEKVLTDLGVKHGFEVTATKDGSVFTRDNLAQYDAFFFYTTGDLTQPGGDGNPPMTAEGKPAFLDAIRGGKAFIGTHSASDTFHGPGDRFDPKPPAKLDPYSEMIGGEFIRHGPQQVARMSVASAKFPGISSLANGFDINDEWYALRNFQPNLHVVLVQETKGMDGRDYQRPPYPATWARMHGQGRVFYTSMGHRADAWTNPNFQSVLLGGLSWALGNVEADITPNIEKVTPKASDIPSEALAR